MKKKLVAACLALAMCFSVTGCRIGSTDYELDVTHVDRHSVFEINGEKCSIEEATLYLCNYKNLYGTAYGVDLWDYDFGDQSLSDYVKAVTLSELTRVFCMDLLATEHEITLNDDEITLCEKAAEDYYGSLTEDEKSFTGITKTKLEECYRHYALANKLYTTLTEGVNEEVSDDEARVITIQQIFVRDEATANEVAEKIKKEEDFTTLASSYNRGTTVECSVARGDLPKVVEDVAFDMEDGEISDKIATEDGYYFIKCLKKYEEALTEENKVTILIRREKEQFNDVYDQFLEEASKGINQDLWDSIEIDLDKDIETESFFAVYDKYFTSIEE